jgi:hypothetical protein
MEGSEWSRDAKGFRVKDIHQEMLPVYSEKCLSRKEVHNWVERFSQGRSKVADQVARRNYAAGGRVLSPYLHEPCTSHSAVIG